MPLLCTYERVSLRFYSEDQPYYEVSGSILKLRTYVRVSIRVNKKRTGRAYILL